MENGPYTLEQVWEFVENGDVTLEDEAWTEGLEDYATVADIPGFQPEKGEEHLGIAPDNMEITIRRDGVEYGPYTPGQVWEFVENDEMALDDEAWFEGCGDYVTVGDVPGFSQASQEEHHETAPGIMEITIRRDGAEYGPYTPGQIWDFVQIGEMTLDDEAWFEGCEDYVTVGNIPGFAHSSGVEPQNPPTGNKAVKVIVTLLVMAGLAVGGYFLVKKFKPELLTANFWSNLVDKFEDGAGIGFKVGKPDVNVPVEFKDQNLEAALREEINKPIGPITRKDLLSVKELHLYDKQISDISLLEGLENLEQLNLYNNQITDISPLAGLENLRWLNLEENRVSDISSLAGLGNLRKLYLYDNQIIDIGPLAGLKNLEDLSLIDNEITDIAILAGLENLKRLSLNENKLTNLSPLAGLENLVELYLDDNRISDLSALAGLENLEELFLQRNKLNDVSPLAGLKYLKNLRLDGNQIPDDQKAIIRKALPKCSIHF